MLADLLSHSKRRISRFPFFIKRYLSLRKQKELGVPFERVFFPTFSLYVSVNRARTMELVYQFTIRIATHVCVRIISREGIARQVRPVFIMSRAPTETKARVCMDLKFDRKLSPVLFHS